MEALRRRAWWGLLIIAVLVGLFGIGDVAGGISADPGIALALTGQGIDEIHAAAPALGRLADLGVRVGGATMLTLALLWSIVLMVGVRRRVPWTWQATMPLWTALVTGIYLVAERRADQAPPPPLISGPIILVITLVLLWASRPRPADAFVNTPGATSQAPG